MTLNILYEDNHLIAVYKPAGVPTQHDATGRPCLLDLVSGYIREKYNKKGNVFLGMVQRLDRPVSGVLVFARTSKAASRLSAQIRERNTLKLYLALTEGVPQPGLDETWTEMISLLKRDGSKTVPARPGDPEAMEGRLRFMTLSSACGRSLLLVDLLTGRKHQIRAQLAAENLPVVGDVKYGARADRGEDAICLHSCALRIFHPVGGRPLTFWADPPPLITDRVRWDDSMKEHILSLFDTDARSVNAQRM